MMNTLLTFIAFCIAIFCIWESLVFSRLPYSDPITNFFSMLIISSIPFLVQKILFNSQSLDDIIIAFQIQILPGMVLIYALLLMILSYLLDFIKRNNGDQRDNNGPDSNGEGATTRDNNGGRNGGTGGGSPRTSSTRGGDNSRNNSNEGANTSGNGGGFRRELAKNSYSSENEEKTWKAIFGYGFFLLMILGNMSFNSNNINSTRSYIVETRIAYVCSAPSKPSVTKPLPLCSQQSILFEQKTVEKKVKVEKENKILVIEQKTIKKDYKLELNSSSAWEEFYTISYSLDYKIETNKEKAKLVCDTDCLLFSKKVACAA